MSFIYDAIAAIATVIEAMPPDETSILVSGRRASIAPAFVWDRAHRASATPDDVKANRVFWIEPGTAEFRQLSGFGASTKPPFTREFDLAIGYVAGEPMRMHVQGVACDDADRIVARLYALSAQGGIAWPSGLGVTQLVADSHSIEESPGGTSGMLSRMTLTLMYERTIS